METLSSAGREIVRPGGMRACPAGLPVKVHAPATTGFQHPADVAAPRTGAALFDAAQKSVEGIASMQHWKFWRSSIIGYVVACGLTAAPASAAEWWQWGTTGRIPLQVLFYDQETLVRSKDTVTVWVNFVFQEPADMIKYSAAGSLHRVRFDCVNKTMSVLSIVNYDGLGSSYDFESSNREQPILPGSPSISLQNYLCTGKKDEMINNLLFKLPPDQQSALAVLGYGRLFIQNLLRSSTSP